MEKLYRVITFFVGISLMCHSCEKDGSDDNLSGKPYIRLEFSEKLVSNKEGSFEVHVSSNTPWTVEPLVKWITVTPTEGNGSRNVTVNYENNHADDAQTPGEERTGTIRFAAEGTIPVKLTVKQGARTFRNPIFMPLPDPYVWRDVQDGTAYYYVCKANGNNINLGKSTKLTALGGTQSVWSLPESSDAWNKRDLWAPELFRINDENGDYWYVYYAAGNPEAAGLEPGKYGSQRTGVIRCPGNQDPLTGRWEDMGMVYTGNAPWHGLPNKDPQTGEDNNTIDNTIYAIDMTTFELNGQRYAVWSGNASKTDGSQRLYIATMSNPWTINSARVEISRPELPWETMQGERINEGPAVVFNPDKTKVFISYSANASWKKEYCLGYLTLNVGDDPMDASNWKKSPNYAFWRVDNVSKSDNPNVDDAKNPNTMNIGGVHGVGHNTFTKSPDGTEDWIVYHTKRYKDNGWDNRDCFIQKITWKEDGTPDFGKPVGWQEEIEVPSGEPL